MKEKHDWNEILANNFSDQVVDHQLTFGDIAQGNGAFEP